MYCCEVSFQTQFSPKPKLNANKIGFLDINVQQTGVHRLTSANIKIKRYMYVPSVLPVCPVFLLNKTTYIVFHLHFRIDYL